MHVVLAHAWALVAIVVWITLKLIITAMFSEIQMLLYMFPFFHPKTFWFTATSALLLRLRGVRGVSAKNGRYCGRINMVIHGIHPIRRHSCHVEGASSLLHGLMVGDHHIVEAGQNTKIVMFHLSAFSHWWTLACSSIFCVNLRYLRCRFFHSMHARLCNESNGPKL